MLGGPIEHPRYNRIENEENELSILLIVTYLSFKASNNTAHITSLYSSAILSYDHFLVDNFVGSDITMKINVFYFDIVQQYIDNIHIGYLCQVGIVRRSYTNYYLIFPVVICYPFGYYLKAMYHLPKG